MNVYADAIVEHFVGQHIYKEEIEAIASGTNRQLYVATVRIEWEEEAE